MSIEAEVQNNTAAIASLNNATADLKNRADRIEDRIPGDASQENKLADKQWVLTHTGLQGSDDGKTVREVASDEAAKAMASMAGSSMNVKLLPPCHANVQLAAPSGESPQEMNLTSISGFKRWFNVELEPDTVYVAIQDDETGVRNYVSIIETSNAADRPDVGWVVIYVQDGGFPGAKSILHGAPLAATGLVITVGDIVYFSDKLRSLF